jgi:hypothetical protein
MAESERLPWSELGPGYEPLVMAWFPHMLPEDRVVWARFLTAGRVRPERIWYDVHVGVAVPVPSDLPEEIRRVSLAVTRKRIDLVCLVGGRYWVVEVKPYASFTALGQILGYARLLSAEYEVPGPVDPVVVCSAVDADLVDDFQRFGVSLEVVGYAE